MAINFDTNGHAKESGLVEVYNYLPPENIYIGMTEEYISVGVGVPANTTTVAPPSALDGYVIIFKPTTNEWSYIENHMGSLVYSTATGSSSLVTEIGPIQEGYTLIAPSSENDVWSGASWVIDPDKQRESTREVNKQKQELIISNINNHTQIWQTQLTLGIINDMDKQSLTEWMFYAQQVQAIDINLEVIDWPLEPDIESI